jgi:hypothetical protein
MAGKLESLGGGEVTKNFLAELDEAGFKLLDLFGDIHIIFLSQFPDLFNPFF